MKVPSTFNTNVAALNDSELEMEKKTLNQSFGTAVAKDVRDILGVGVLGLTTIYSFVACIALGGAVVPGALCVAAGVGFSKLMPKVEQWEEEDKVREKRLEDVRDELALRDPDAVRAALEPDKRTDEQKDHDREVGITPPFGPDTFTAKAKAIFGGVDPARAVLEVDGLSKGIGKNPFTLEYFNEVSTKRREEAKAVLAALSSSALPSAGAPRL